jgi:hypothetical protein
MLYIGQLPAPTGFGLAAVALTLRAGSCRFKTEFLFRLLDLDLLERCIHDPRCQDDFSIRNGQRGALGHGLVERADERE